MSADGFVSKSPRSEPTGDAVARTDGKASSPTGESGLGATSKPHSELVIDLAMGLREYAKAVDADRGMRSGLTACMRDAAEKLDRLEEQNESYVRLLEAADAAWRWIGKEYPNVVEAMPPALYRELREARVPYPRSELS